MDNPDPQDIRRASRIFKALSHPDRLRLACRLSTAEPTTQKDLLREFQWPQSTMARHVHTLRELGLLTAERAGLEVRLEVSGPLVKDLLDAMCHWVHPETGEAFGEVAQSEEVLQRTSSTT